MQFDSPERRIMWYAAMLSFLAQGILLFIGRNMYLGIIFFSVGIVFLNCFYFLERPAREVFSFLIVALQLSAILIFPRWYIGILALPVLTAICFHRRSLLRCLGVGTVCAAILFQYLFSKPGIISILIYSSIAILSIVIWEALLYWMSQAMDSNAKLRAALSASAVDALEQRSLREQIAKNQVINENNARLEERERISRDIHNYVGHTLSAATVTLDAASMLVPSDQERALEKIDIANSRVHEAISSVRSVVRTLDARDDRVAMNDYLLSLEKWVEEFQMDTNYKVYHNFSQITSQVRIPIQTASFLSSSLSELLTNGIKHGKAVLFVITMVLDENHIRLKVQDNGTGWGKISANEKKLRLSRGFGLRKIKEYTENAGGNFSIESEDGFTVSLSLPFEGENT